MTFGEGERFTAALYGIVMREFWGPDSASGAPRAASAAR